MTGVSARTKTMRKAPRAAATCDPVDALLNRLDAVRQVGAGRWRARCPAHDGKNANVLSIGEGNDGTVLLKCFHGCTTAEVVGALGFELSDLFPRIDWQSSGTHAGVGRTLKKYAADEANHPHLSALHRPRVDWPALIAACERDLLLVKILLTAIAKREPINEVDAAACQAAATHIYTLIQEARNG